MKTTTKICARFTTIGYPADTVIIDSQPMINVIKDLAHWIQRVRMQDRIEIVFAKDVNSFEPGGMSRKAGLASLLEDILGGDESDDESERQGVVTSHHTNPGTHLGDGLEVDNKDTDGRFGISVQVTDNKLKMPQFRTIPDSNQ